MRTIVSIPDLSSEIEAWALPRLLRGPGSSRYVSLRGINSPPTKLVPACRDGLCPAQCGVQSGGLPSRNEVKGRETETLEEIIGYLIRKIIKAKRKAKGKI